MGNRFVSKPWNNTISKYLSYFYFDYQPSVTFSTFNNFQPINKVRFAPIEKSVVSPFTILLIFLSAAEHHFHQNVIISKLLLRVVFAKIDYFIIQQVGRYRLWSVGVHRRLTQINIQT